MPEPKIAFDQYIEQTTSSNNNPSSVSRFHSVSSSGDFDKPSGEGETNNNNVLGSFNAWIGKAYNKTKEVAINMKDKVSEMDLGTKIKNAGIKTIEVVKDTGTKVVNKGTEAANSSTVQNFAKKANDGVNYLFGKVNIVYNKLFGSSKKEGDQGGTENK